jgi:hypothetical protein
MTTATSASNRTYGFSAPCLATAKRSFGTTTEMPFRRCTLEMNAHDRQIDHPPHGGHRERWLAGFARLIARQAWNALRHEPRLPPPYHRLGFAGSSHDLGRAAAFVGGKDDFGARQTCFCGALRLPTIASSRRRSPGVTLTTIPALMTRA